MVVSEETLLTSLLASADASGEGFSDSGDVSDEVSEAIGGSGDL